MTSRNQARPRNFEDQRLFSSAMAPDFEDQRFFGDEVAVNQHVMQPQFVTRDDRHVTEGYPTEKLSRRKKREML